MPAVTRSQARASADLDLRFSDVNEDIDLLLQRASALERRVADLAFASRCAVWTDLLLVALIAAVAWLIYETGEYAHAAARCYVKVAMRTLAGGP